MVFLSGAASVDAPTAAACPAALPSPFSSGLFPQAEPSPAATTRPSTPQQQQRQQQPLLPVSGIPDDGICLTEGRERLLCVSQHLPAAMAAAAAAGDLAWCAAA
jgi:hypothetical protein